MVSADAVDTQGLTWLWQSRWPDCPPVADWLRGVYPHRWVRFHSLPGSKRYADDEAEYRVILERHNTVLTELDVGRTLLVITCDWTTTPEPPAWRTPQLCQLDPAGVHWQTILEDDSDDALEPPAYTQLYASQRQWAAGVIDDLLRSVADDELAGVILAPTDLAWLYHPYDGGADVLLPDQYQRDALEARHYSWLSGHPAGL